MPSIKREFPHTSPIYIQEEMNSNNNVHESWYLRMLTVSNWREGSTLIGLKSNLITRHIAQNSHGRMGSNGLLALKFRIRKEKTHSHFIHLKFFLFISATYFSILFHHIHIYYYIYIYSSYYCFKVIQLYRFSFISLRFLFWNHVLFSFRICLSIFVFLLNCVNNIIVILSQFFIPICW